MGWKVGSLGVWERELERVGTRKGGWREKVFKKEGSKREGCKRKG